MGIFKSKKAEGQKPGLSECGGQQEGTMPQPRSIEGTSRRLTYHYTCSYCQNEITTHRADTKYCSAACRQAAMRKRRKQAVTRWSVEQVFMNYLIDLLQSILKADKTQVTGVAVYTQLIQAKIGEITFFDKADLDYEYTYALQKVIVPFLRSSCDTHSLYKLEDKLFVIPDKLREYLVQINNRIANDLGWHHMQIRF